MSHMCLPMSPLVYDFCISSYVFAAVLKVCLKGIKMNSKELCSCDIVIK